MSGFIGRFSILRLMGVVSLMAAECGLLRFTMETTMLEFLIILPLVNFMLLGFPRLRTGQENRSFWIGFEAVGVTLIGLCFLLAWCAPGFLALLTEPIQWLGEHKWLSDDSPERLPHFHGDHHRDLCAAAIASRIDRWVAHISLSNCD